MLIVRKIMKAEIVEYVAANEDSKEVVKYNMRKDGTHKTNKFINLSNTQMHGRYFKNAGKFFSYLVLNKDYERMEISYGEGF